MSDMMSKVRLPWYLTGEREAGMVSIAYVLLALAITGLVVYGAYFGGITALLLRSLFFSGVAAAGLAGAALQMRSGYARAACYVLAAAALVPGPYLWHSYLDIIMRGAIATRTDEIIFLALLLVVIVLVRLTLGRALVVLSAVSLAYAYFGYLIPGKYGHGGYDISRLASTLFLSTEGFFGVPMGVAVEYIFLFALLGTLLMKIGTGEVFVDIARGVTGRVQGGPGLSAALSSAMLGTINGSAVANVVTTGTFTIPLMKRNGYSPRFAAATESAASTGGQILPPVMGAAAFVMADVINTSYLIIIGAALIPALLFYLAIWMSVHFEAKRLGLQPLPASERPSLREGFRNSEVLFIPVAILATMLVVAVLLFVTTVTVLASSGFMACAPPLYSEPERSPQLVACPL
jgi:TRAP transporter 4TM/12TM fusion protein